MKIRQILPVPLRRHPSCSPSQRARAAPAAPPAAGAAAAGRGSSPTSPAPPSWCGTKKITLGLTRRLRRQQLAAGDDGLGQGRGRQVPERHEFTYADGQGDTQKAISDIKGLVAKGVNALVVFPDAGNADAARAAQAYKAGVVTVPYRVDPGGKDGMDYDEWVGADFAHDGKNWANWIKQNLPDGGNILFLSGPAGQQPGHRRVQGRTRCSTRAGKYKLHR